MKRLVLFMFLSFGLSSSITYSQWVNCFTKGDYILFSDLTVLGDRIFASTTMEGVFVSTDFGNSWTEKSNGITNKYLSFMTVFGNTLYLGSNGVNQTDAPGGLYTSNDSGETWTTSNNILTDKAIISMLIDGNRMLVGTGFDKGIFISFDIGTTWEAMNTGFELSNFWVHDIFIKNGRVLIGTTPGLYFSDDVCKSWSFKKDNNQMAAINTFAGLGDKIFAGGTFGFFTSTNNGDSWEEPNNALYRICINDLMVYGNAIFAATEKGIFVSTDSGNTWEAKNKGLLGLDCSNITFCGGYVYVISNSFSGGIVSRAKLSEFLTDVQETNSDLSSFISPNPATDFMEITNPSEGLEPSKGSLNSVKIFNVFGETVVKSSEVLNNSQFSIHNSQLRIDVSGLPSGVYFVKIGNNVQKFIKL